MTKKWADDADWPRMDYAVEKAKKLAQEPPVPLHQVTDTLRADLVMRGVPEDGVNELFSVSMDDKRPNTFTLGPGSRVVDGPEFSEQLDALVAQTGKHGTFRAQRNGVLWEITMTAQCTADMVSAINAVLVDKEFAIAIAPDPCGPHA